MDNEEKLLQDNAPSPSPSSVTSISSNTAAASATSRLVRTPSPSTATSPHTPPLQPLVQTFTAPLHRKKGRLQRSERLQTVDSGSNSSSGNNSTSTPTSYSAWEALVKESFGQIAWPIKITSWELVDDRVKVVPNR